MKIELFIKAPSGGFRFYDFAEVPDGFGDTYKVPLRQPISVRLDHDPDITRHDITPILTFRRVHDPLGRALDKNPRYYQEI